MTPCAIHACAGRARWLHDGRPFCRSHADGELIRTGRPATLMPPEDVVERLLDVLQNDDLCREAADEIRRLRARVAELKAGRSGPLACKVTIEGGTS